MPVSSAYVSLRSPTHLFTCHAPSCLPAHLLACPPASLESASPARLAHTLADHPLVCSFPSWLRARPVNIVVRIAGAPSNAICVP
ncbi:uncharacterized protein B0H18DRAFT_967035 [Fomitopsis serialis]|uniref:uncharacterized protein n=1 Tax=Fomitopsis serialis TaxID=139415 RepID=UPI0020073F65|nr:uncharacterized protein B0H18DRAFT_967035 [Neoantrodia serialis]KAH9938410.1 hypothetical protein B0H18DRAFT_967035 [Neoantrodia serialis]